MKTFAFSHITSKLTFEFLFKSHLYFELKSNQIVYSKIPINIGKINNQWSSYFQIFIKKNNIFFDVDIFSAFRVFYVKTEKGWLFSDNWNSIKKYGCKKNISSGARNFFIKHNYFLFDDTINQNIKKMPPCVFLVISKRQVFYKEKNLEVISLNHKRYLLTVYKEIIKNLNLADKLKLPKANVKLLGSGGADSSLIAYALLKLKIPFEVHCNVSGWVTTSDLKKISKLGSFCATNDIPFYSYKLKTLDIKQLKKFYVLDPNTAHTYLLFDEIYKNFNKNDICIVGQGVDSIFSFGPSNNRPISFLARQSIFSNSSILLFFITKLVNLYFGLKLSKPKTKVEQMVCFLNHTNYFALINKKEKDINEYCNKTLLKLPFKIINKNKLKQIGFLAGADNSVFYNLDKIYKTTTVFPFMSNKIYQTISGSNKNFLEQIVGKYVIRILLNYINRKKRKNFALPIQKIRDLRKNVFHKL